MGTKPDIDTTNDFLFGSNGQSIAPMFNVIITSREQAYRTAAWIKTMAIVLPSGGHTFEEIEQAIRST